VTGIPARNQKQEAKDPEFAIGGLEPSLAANPSTIDRDKHWRFYEHFD